MTDSEPLTTFVPDQPSEAVHAVASVEDQLSVIVPPSATLVGLEVSVTVGAGATAAALTVTVALSLTLPPLPVQVIVYAVVALGVTTSEPLSSILGFQSAVQAVASVELQLSVADCP